MRETGERANARDCSQRISLGYADAYASHTHTLPPSLPLSPPLRTSLGGLNADQVATTAAARSLQGDALGTVCIKLQQTPQDGKMTLRIFGKSDDVLLAERKEWRQRR